jgi:hypothetical protein
MFRRAFERPLRRRAYSRYGPIADIWSGHSCIAAHSPSKVTWCRIISADIGLEISALRGRRNLSGLHKPIRKAIGLALDRRIEHLDRVRIILVREHGAFRVKHEAGRLHLLVNGCGLNAV